MAASEADICNLALNAIGHTQFIASLSEDSEEAAVCNQNYAQCRDEVLEALHWPFATRRSVLTEYTGSDWASATTYAAADLSAYGGSIYYSLAAANTNHQPDTSPTWWAKLTRSGWDNVFSLPAGMIRARRIYPGTRNPRPDEEIPFDIEDDATLDAQVLVTDEDTPELIYTAQISNVLRFPASFVRALSWRLAIDLVAGLRKDAKLALSAEASYERYLGKAAMHARMSVMPDADPDPDFLANR